MSNVINMTDNVRSYKTKKNLLNALDKLYLTEFRPLIVKTYDDRFTAVFSASRIANADCADMGVASQHGFMTI